MGILDVSLSEVLADLNARFGLKIFSSPKYIAFTRKFGIVGVILAGLSALGFVVSLIFGLNGR